MRVGVRFGMRCAPTRASTAVALALMTTMAACAEMPLDTTDHAGGVRLQLIGSAIGTEADVRVAHLFRGSVDSLVVLARQRVVLDTAVQAVDVPVDVTECLRMYAAETCPLRIDVFLRVDGRVVDSAGVGPIPARGSGQLDVPPISFRAASRLVAVDSVIRPRVNDVAAVLVVGLDARGDTLRGRPFTWTSSDTTVVVITGAGRVQSRRVGTATVTAAREGMSAQVIVAVTPVRTLTITGTLTTLIESGVDSARATIVTETGFPATLRYRSSDSTVLRVGATGQLTAARRGVADLTILAVADTFQRVTRRMTVTPFQAAARWDLQRVSGLPAPPIAGFGTDIWGSSLSDIYATMSSSLYRWNGSSWAIVPSLPCCMLAVTGTSATDVWAAGSTVHRWNGSTWATNLFRPGRTIRDLWANGSSVVAVGDSGYIAAFDGATWTVQPSGTAENLRGVWGRSASEIYAVGTRGVILRYNGTTWSRMVSPVTDSLFAVNGDSSVVYAAGWRSDSLGFDNTVLELVGGAWRRVGGRATSGLWSLWRTNALGWVASGSFGTVEQIRAGALVPGTTEAIGDRDGFNNLVGVGFPNGAMLVGSDGVAIQLTGTTYRLLNLEPRYYSVCAAPNGNIFLSGHLGLIDQFDGSTWRNQSAGSRYIYEIWCGAANAGVAVGAFGSLSRFNGTSWQQDVSPTGTTWLRTAWGVDANTVFVGGDNGTILRWNGSVWSGRNGVIAGTNINALFGFSATDVFAVGSGGRIARFDGTNWQPMTSPTTVNLHGVWGSAPNDVWAVGERQSILRWNGQRWNVVARTDTAASTFHGVWGSGPNDVYFAGCGSVSTPVVRWDGARFITELPGGCHYKMSGSASGGVLLGEALRNVRRGIAPNGSVLVRP